MTAFHRAWQHDLSRSIALMRNLPDPVLKVNQFLPVGPAKIEDRLLSLESKIAELASTPLDQSQSFLELVLEVRLEGSNAPRSGAELHKQSAEASRVDPEAGPVILAHMRGRLRTALVGEALKRRLRRYWPNLVTWKNVWASFCTGIVVEPFYAFVKQQQS
jgi:hypothetical protein